MFQRKSSSLAFSGLFAGVATFGLLLLSGCGVGSLAAGSDSPVGGGTNGLMGGILHGGPNPISGATITLYTTTSSGYGATATAVATTVTNTNGAWSLTLPTNIVACPSGEYAYVAAYGGATGAQAANANSLLMVPIGACSSNYTSTGSGPYVNTYIGPTLFMNELTTAISAYTLGNFMTLTTTSACTPLCTVNIGAPANNHGTASVGSSSVAPTAAGLGHAFANALSLINVNTGQPNAYTNGGSSASTGGVIPDAEIYLLGNILQACVNSTGVTGSNSGTSNDSSGCGKLFSFTTPPSGVSGSSTPTNTLQAMLDLAKYPVPTVNTWPTNCNGASGSGTTTATQCLFNIATSQAYPGGLTSPPPDWALAVVYTSSYGLNTTSTTPACTTSPNCPGLTYPFYVALDYQDNVYVLNYDANASTLPQSASTWTNIIGITNGGAPIFATPEDTSHKAISIIGTDLAQHVFGANAVASSPTIQVYSATSGAILATPSYNNSEPLAVAADPFNNLYVATYIETVNLRKFAYSGTPTSPVYAAPTTYSAISLTTAGGPYQLVFDSNLDLYEYLDPAYGGSGSPYACLLTNQSSSTYTYMSAAPSPAYTNCTTGGNNAVAIPGNTGSGVIAAGIAPTSTNGALAIGSTGMTKLTRSGSTIAAASTTALPAVTGGILYNRYVSVDGKDWGYSADGGNGQVSGVSVFDSTDTLALGTYKGCFVYTATSITCGTVNSAGATQAPMASPRATGIDSSGDIWVVSGNTQSLTELIGAAAPTWPGLSMAKAGLPQ